MEAEKTELSEQTPTTGDPSVNEQVSEVLMITEDAVRNSETLSLENASVVEVPVAGSSKEDSASPSSPDATTAATNLTESGEPQIISRASPALLQAILLASGEPVSFVKLQEIMRCSRPEVMTALDTLRQHCATDTSGVEVVAVGERLQLRTKVAFAEPVRELLAVKPRKLSQAALETLSVIAYQQPIVKSEIDKIRGVDVAPTLKTLLERKIIKIIGYQASVGQPALYGTTEDFLRIFGLASLSELPALRDLRALAKEPGEVGENSESDDSSESASEAEMGSGPLTISTEQMVMVSEVANNDETSLASSDQPVKDDQSEVVNS